MEEYIMQVTDTDGESLSLKIYGVTTAEAMDNIVCMEQIESVEKVTRVKDNYTIQNKGEKISLNKLRELRKKIKNELLLRKVLIEQTGDIKIQ